MDHKIWIEFMLDDDEWYRTQLKNEEEIKKLSDILAMQEIEYIQIGSFYIKKEHLKAVRIM